MTKPFFQGSLKVHLLLTAGASSSPEKQTNLKACSSVQQISVKPGQFGEGEMREDGKRTQGEREGCLPMQ